MSLVLGDCMGPEVRSVMEAPGEKSKNVGANSELRPSVVGKGASPRARW